MKLLFVVKVLGSLCLLLTDGLPVPEDDSPEIIGPDFVQIKTHPGAVLVLHCDALSNCEDDVTLIYWLVNDTFPEDAPNSNRMMETNESTLEEGAILQRSLVLKNITEEDLESTFTCVVTNAVGMAQKRITLTEQKQVAGVVNDRRY